VVDVTRAIKLLTVGLAGGSYQIRRYVDETPGHDMRLFRADLDEIRKLLADLDPELRRFRACAGLDRDDPGGPWRGVTIDATATVVDAE
jgi:hypothetical protein